MHYIMKEETDASEYYASFFIYMKKKKYFCKLDC
jgi:hypothetical protein